MDPDDSTDGNEPKPQSAESDRELILKRRKRFLATALAPLALIACQEPKPQPEVCLSVVYVPEPSANTQPTAEPSATAAPSAEPSATAVPSAHPMPCLSVVAPHVVPKPVTPPQVCLSPPKPQPQVCLSFDPLDDD